ncbi:L-type lectin-domain containing receptor kinase SIT2-like isoform X2 [Magnolia sinica]|uniref:L-type lectin-domain containing receptor kinase SIT2-like isoform X2 n=1 Tax=Magnolia sinica TaxID=86752 RepID=UPI002659153C|nr:L-type lectin-domain containing receptor kinase SIT2-like isoform X2 [Magnolia sinica]
MAKLLRVVMPSSLHPLASRTLQMMNGEARAINVSSLASLPWKERSRKKSKVLITVALPVIVAAVVLITILGIVFMIRRKKKSAEVLEDWELDYGPHRFSYKDLSIATKGFADKELLGTGGFGKVYRGVLPISKIEVAVKRVSHESRQGMREFVAEVVSLGRLKHRNLVQLLGYCRRKQELLLVYDLMHNGSLDKFLFDQPKMTLDWSHRYRIIKGVASGLLYLHEDWEQVVIHRDIKASNVLLDEEMNGRLGDFGLARLYGHGSFPQTTHVAGTFGYLAPELAKTGKATTSTDVFAFGVFMLEVACGRRPIEHHASAEESILIDWVLECWRRGTILNAADLKLESGYVAVEMELVMKLGLLCSHPHSVARPTMRQVMQYLDGDAPLPQLFPNDFVVSTFALGQNEDSDDRLPPYLSSIEASILSGGR